MEEFDDAYLFCMEYIFPKKCVLRHRLRKIGWKEFLMLRL